MKAVFLEGKRNLQIREISELTVPEDGLIMQVEACGICGSDLRRWREGTGIRSSKFGIQSEKYYSISNIEEKIKGIIPGHEAAGVVIEVGEKVEDYEVGERLAIAPDIHCGHCYYCRRGMYNLCDNMCFIGITPGYPGALAEKIVLTREALTRGIVYEMPGNISFAEASLAEPCSSVLACHHNTGTSLGDTVVVIGAGPIGCLHIAVAKARGASVIVSQRSKKRQELAKRFEPELVIDALNEDLVSRVHQLTNGIGADIVVCANPVAETQTQAVEAVRKAGKVVLFGGLPKSNPMTTLDANKIHYGEVEVVGAFSYHPLFHKLALELISRRIIPTELLITHTFPLEKIDEAFETTASGNGLKVIVKR